MRRRLWIAAVCIVCLSFFLFRYCYWGPPPTTVPTPLTDDTPIAMVADNITEAKLIVHGEPIRVTGKFNLYLTTSINKLNGRVVEIAGFSLSLFQVEQTRITGRDAAMNKATINVAFNGSAPMELDKAYQTLSGDIPVQAHFPQIDEFLSPSRYDDGLWISHTQQGKMHLTVKFRNSLLDKFKSMPVTQKSNQIAPGEVQAAGETDDRSPTDLVFIETELSSANITIDELSEAGIPGYEIAVAPPSFTVKGANLAGNRVAKNTRIQRVSIGNVEGEFDDPFENDPRATGRGYADGEDAIKKLWNDFGVNVRVNPKWKKIVNSDWYTPNQALVKRILVSVDTSPCVAMVFVECFSDGSYDNGGGAADINSAGYGVIVTSDALAGTGNITHLAHELGHAFGLGHPNNPNMLFKSSKGTLMCPSGQVDNLQINSYSNVHFALSHNFSLEQVSGRFPFCCTFDDCNCDECPPST